jgi:hypothetical protein
VGADSHSRRRVLMTALGVIGVLGVLGTLDVSGALRVLAAPVPMIQAQAPAQTPDSPYQGRLAKAVFLSERVGDAIAEIASGAPAASRAMLTAAAARARQSEPALAAPAGADPAAVSRLARRRALADGMVALVATPEARAESVAASDALVPATPSSGEDAQGIGIAVGLAELAEGYLKAHRESALTPYLYTYLMVQNRLAFERQTAAKALDAQKASAKKYRTFRQRALASTDPLVRAVAEDIDAQLYLERPTPEHPKNFDPDACCRDK